MRNIHRGSCFRQRFLVMVGYMTENWDESRDEKSTFRLLRDNDESERSRVPERFL